MREIPKLNKSTSKSRLRSQSLAAALLIFIVGGFTGSLNAQTSLAQTSHAFTFALTADMRVFAGQGTYDNSQYFRGAVEGVKAHGPGAFMISLGDEDPPAGSRWTISSVLGSAYRWIPVAGNHEIETPSDLTYLLDYNYGNVTSGPDACPQTTFSFDYSNVHFVVLNEYCSSSGDAATDGDISNYLYQWLSADLTATRQEHILVFGHEPAYPQPDVDTGRWRHASDGLNLHAANRDRFWKLLKAKGVTAFFNGHTHDYSLVNINGVWQMDAGHARGIGDTGAMSTYVLVTVDGPSITYETYRYNLPNGPYVLRYSGELATESAQEKVFLPLIAY